METLLAVMLYLQLIISPGTYHLSHVKALELQYKPQIEAVHNDPGQMQVVDDVYRPEVTHITIIDDGQTTVLPAEIEENIMCMSSHDGLHN